MAQPLAAVATISAGAHESPDAVVGGGPVEFSQYLRRDPLVEDVTLQGPALVRLQRELKGGARLAQLVGLAPEEIGGLRPDQLRDVVASYDRWTEWKREAERVGRGLEPVEREVAFRTSAAHQLRTIERGVKLCEAGRVEAVKRSGVLAACLELWDAVLAEARRRGRMRSRLASPDHPRASEYEPYLQHVEPLEDLRPHRWLAMRRGQREGVLVLELDLSQAALEDQVRARRGRLGDAFAARTDASLLEELAGNDVDAALVSDLDQWARTEAIRAACKAYGGLLRAPRLAVDRLAAVHLGSTREHVGAVIVDGEGQVLDSLEVDPSRPGWIDAVVKLAGDAKARHLAVPSDTQSSKRLADLEQALARGVALLPIRPVALTEGREALGEASASLPKSVASALVLAHRAQRPFDAWGAIDPVRTGVGEYQGDIDEHELREALSATREHVRRETAKGKAPAAVVAPGAGRLHPMVRSVADLTPGMMLSGVVTNVTGFGAFVSVGLEYEGLVHVSEMSDEYVGDPSAAISIGQKVMARVLSVDRQRRRISLSLRKEPSSRSAASRPTSKAQALRDLEKLFRSR